MTEQQRGRGGGRASMEGRGVEEAFAETPDARAVGIQTAINKTLKSAN